MDPFGNLPNEVLLLQAINLPLETITQTCLVSKRFNEAICENEYFWQQKFHADYGFNFEVPESWKQLYEEFSLIRGHLERFRRYTSSVINNWPYASSLYKEDLIKFFSNANLGPLVNYSTESMKQRLNDILLFTKPYIAGLPNPLYGIVKSGMIMMFFAIHSYYSNMRQQNSKALTASQEMRDKLGQLIVSSGINPNIFIYIEFSSLIRKAKIRDISDIELRSLIPEVDRVYRNLFPDYPEQITPEVILDYQENLVMRSKEYKDKLQVNIFKFEKDV